MIFLAAAFATGALVWYWLHGWASGFGLWNKLPNRVRQVTRILVFLSLLPIGTDHPLPLISGRRPLLSAFSIGCWSSYRNISSTLSWPWPCCSALWECFACVAARAGL